MSDPDRRSSWTWVFVAGILLVAAAALVIVFVPLARCRDCNGLGSFPDTSVNPGSPSVWLPESNPTVGGPVVIAPSTITIRIICEDCQQRGRVPLLHLLKIRRIRPR